MRVVEVMQRQVKAKHSVDKRTDWEKNAAKLRSREAKLNAQSPVPPVKHRP